MSELQAIVDVIKSVGLAGQTMFIWYMLKSVLVSIFRYGTIVLALYYVRYAVVYITNTCTGIKDLRYAAGIGTRGELTRMELNRMKRMLQKQADVPK